MSRLSRRELIQSVAATAVLPLVGARALRAASPGRAQTPVNPAVVAEIVPERFRALPLEAQTLEGLLGQRMQRNVEGRLLQIDREAFLSGFTNRDAKGDNARAWEGEHAGKFLDAACDALRYRDDAALRSLVSTVAAALLASQDADGYLGTYSAERRWTGWDVWVHKYNLIGLLKYHELTDDPAAIAACRKMGDLLASTFGDTPGQRDILTAGDHVGMAATSVLEPMCRLYRLTGEARYLDLCRYIVRSYDRPGGPRLISAMQEHGSAYRTANGKAYEMLSNFNGLIDLYRLTGDATLLNAVLRAWEDIGRHQLYCTGTMSCREHFQPHDQRLSLPSSNVGETCVSVTWLQLNWRLLRLTGEARFAQEIERTVYNHLLAAQDPLNGNICYYTALAGRKEYTNAVLCCVSSGPRGIALLPNLVWGLEDGAFVVHQYTAGRAQFEIGGVPVQVRSQTAFPHDGEVTLSVAPQRAAQFTIKLRVPEWATRFEVDSGKQKLAGQAGQMLSITQRWGHSSQLKIRMELATQVISGAPSYPEYVALKRGPQVLALEKAVNPAIPYLHRVSLPDSPAMPLIRVSADRMSQASGGNEKPVYTAELLVGLPGKDGPLELARREVQWVPFADAREGAVWVGAAGHARRDVPAVTAFVRARASSIIKEVSFKSADYRARDQTEFLTDENLKTVCISNPRDQTFGEFTGGPPGQRGDAVWFAAMLDGPQNISRVVFNHGVLAPEGGWFDTSAGKPTIEVARAPIARWKDFPFALLPDIAVWEKIAVIEQYPASTGSQAPTLSDGQAFEVRLAQPMTVYAIRVVGKPGGEYASCAQLSAYA